MVKSPAPKEIVKEEPKKKSVEHEKPPILVKAAPKKKKEEKKAIPAKPPMPPRTVPSVVEHTATPTLRYSSAAASSVTKESSAEGTPTKPIVAQSPGANVTSPAIDQPSVASILMGNQKGKRPATPVQSVPIAKTPTLATIIQRTPSPAPPPPNEPILEMPDINLKIPALKDLVPAYESLQSKHNHLNSMLDVSFLNIPDVDSRY